MLCIVLFAGVSYLVFIYDLAEYFPKLNPISTFCREINAQAKPSDMVCQYKGTDAHFMIYYSRNNVSSIRYEKEMKRLLSSKRKIYCVSANKEAAAKLISSLKGRTVVLDKSANYILFTNKP